LRGTLPRNFRDGTLDRSACPEENLKRRTALTRENKRDFGTAVLGAFLIIVLILGTGLISARLKPRPGCCPVFLKKPAEARSFNAGK
jgi:hypothetical protein